MKRFSKVFTILVFLFLYLPMIVLGVASFNKGTDIGSFTGFTLSQYAALFKDGTLLPLLRNSVIIAVLAALISTVLGTMAAVYESHHVFVLFHSVFAVGDSRHMLLAGLAGETRAVCEFAAQCRCRAGFGDHCHRHLSAAVVDFRSNDDHGMAVPHDPARMGARHVGPAPGRVDTCAQRQGWWATAPSSTSKTTRPLCVSHHSHIAPATTPATTRAPANKPDPAHTHPASPPMCQPSLTHNDHERARRHGRDPKSQQPQQSPKHPTPQPPSQTTKVPATTHT